MVEKFNKYTIDAQLINLMRNKTDIEPGSFQVTNNKKIEKSYTISTFDFARVKRKKW